MESLHQPGEVIAGRYHILGLLAQGGMGITYAAQDLQGHQSVALKALSLQRMSDFKVLELFEREARILQQLNHLAIPRYLDYFEVDQSKTRYFYIAQQLAEGDSLARLIEQDWYPNEATVRDIAIQLLEILIYLQQLTPPVLHRDIKPQNIIRQANGQIFLVDFGAVQDTYHNTLTAGNTVVGTYGYMAPEQFRGQTTLATDLYSLGATLLFLLTCRDPADLPQRKLKIDFRPHVQVSKSFADWLDHMLDPIAEDRFQSAAEALAVLRGEQTYSRLSYRVSRQPTRSLIALKQTGTTLSVEIPPIGLRSRISRYLALLSVILMGILYWLLLTQMPVDSETLEGNVLYFSPLALIVVDSSIVGCFLWYAATHVKLEVTPETIDLERWFLGLRLQKVRGKTKQRCQLELQPIAMTLTFTFWAGWREYHFGAALPESDKVWLQKEFKSFLQAMIPPENQDPSPRRSALKIRD